jgi:hypothetical protein
MKSDCLSQLELALEPLDINGLARQTGFRRRRSKKLTPLTFIQSCCLLLGCKQVSFRNWAIMIGTLTNQTYAKQSLFERMTDRAALFVRSVVLSLVGHLSLGQQQRVLPPALNAFKRVIIEDSTVLTLAKKLMRFFRGGRNQHGSQGGMLRVQGYYDLKHERFIHFSHSAFVRNDLTLAGQVLRLLRADDLLIRDLGYLVLEVLGKVQKKGAFFLSRFKHNLTVYEPGGQPLDLAALLSHRTRSLDKDVLLGAKEQLPVRIVAVKVSEEVANLRRHQARKNRHFHPTQKHLQLLGWDILITNASREQLPTPLVAKVYGLRFHIETIFKAWKSHFYLEDLPAGSRAEVETLLYARLLLITIFEVRFFARWDYQIQDRAGPLSVLKVAGFMQLYLPVTLLGELQPNLETALQKQVAYHCTYEKRRSRKNFIEKLELT